MFSHPKQPHARSHYNNITHRLKKNNPVLKNKIVFVCFFYEMINNKSVLAEMIFPCVQPQ